MKHLTKPERSRMRMLLALSAIIFLFGVYTNGYWLSRMMFWLSGFWCAEAFTAYVIARKLRRKPLWEDPEAEGDHHEEVRP